MSDGALVLVADDDEDILTLVKAVLQREGHEVIAVPDGAQALACVQAESPDLAVLDISMPELDGLEVLRRVRADAETRDLPVVLLSAQAQEADVARGYATGANAYIKKPFSPRELAERVEALLSQSDGR
jgi:two-component system, OmpR family, response regulator MtrA